jgi:hypothetical protein
MNLLKIHKINEVAGKYNKSIKLNDQADEEKFIQWNSSYAKIIIKELLYNAIKFSAQVRDNYFSTLRRSWFTYFGFK